MNYYITNKETAEIIGNSFSRERAEEILNSARHGERMNKMYDKNYKIKYYYIEEIEESK